MNHAALSDSPPRHKDIKRTVLIPIPETTNRVATQIVDAACKVHSNLGPGLLEGVYETCLASELRKRGLKVERQVVLPVVHDGLHVDAGLRLDIVAGACVILELNAVEKIHPVHKAQMLTYLKLSGHRLGFLINFNVAVIGAGIVRIAL